MGTSTRKTAPLNMLLEPLSKSTPYSISEAKPSPKRPLSSMSKRATSQVIIPEYGLEGTVNLIESYDKSYKFNEDEIEYNPDDCYVVVNRHKLTIFEKVQIKIFVDSSNIQNEKIIMSL